jgi:hypothetical protein
MRSEDKIKVFISSKCDGELTNFAQVVNADSKVIAEKAIRISYNLVRKALKVALEETGLFDVYVFESEYPTTSPVGEDYLDELDVSHVCLFLIDNLDDEISKGLLTEITRAQEQNKKSIYLFLNHPDRKKTVIQENLMGIKGAHYFVVNDVREFIDKGYKSIVNDMVKKYQQYCRGIFDIEKEILPVEIAKESFPVETTYINKQLFKNLGLTKNKLVSLVYQTDGNNVQSSDLDKLCLSVLEFLLGEKKFNDIDLTYLLKALGGLQSPELHSMVSKRWEAISSYYGGDLDNAIITLESIYNEYSEDLTIPKWLINDVLIDWRNLETINDQVKNVINFSIQEKIEKQDSLVFFPLIDRFTTNISNDISKRNFDLLTSPYSNFIFSLESLFGYISNYLFTAIYYGSYTHIIFTLSEVQKVFLDLVQKDSNLLYKIQLLRISVLLDDNREFAKIADKYKSSLSHSTTKEILDLYKLVDAKPLLYQKAKWKIILFKEIGYYFSDVDYETISHEILEFSYKWVRDENLNITLIENLIDAFKFNRERLPQEKIVNFAMEVFERKHYRFFDSLFDLLRELNVSAMSPELFQRLLSQIRDMLENEEIKRRDLNIKSLFIRIRKHRDDFSTEIDKIVEKYYPEFYKQDYSLEIFPDDRSIHIPRYLDSIRERNKVQGKNGTYIGYVDNPYITIKNIIEFDKISLSEEMLENLLKEIFNTLFSETQTYSEKINSIQLLLCLKRQELPFSYDWNNYHSNLKQNIAKVEKGSSNFFANEGALLLQLYVVFLRITFRDNYLQETLETLSLISNSSAREIIDSLLALEDFLEAEKHNLAGNSIISVLVQYMATFCFHDDDKIRRSTVRALSQLIDSQYANFVVNRLAKMMDDNDFGVKVFIVRQAHLIRKHSEETFSYITMKAKIDNNYLVRKVIENIVGE